jgi:hypothetical protein
MSSSFIFCPNNISWKLEITKLLVIKVFSQFPFFLIRIVGGGVQLGPLGTSASEWPIVPALGDYDDGEFGGMKIGRGNRSTSATLSTTNPTWPDPGANSGRRGGKPATNRLSHGAASVPSYFPLVQQTQMCSRGPCSGHHQSVLEPKIHIHTVKLYLLYFRLLRF